MKQAGITIMASGGGRLGQYSVSPAPYGSAPGSSRLRRLVGDWLKRHRQRRDLTQLDQRMLKDIGVTRLEVEREARKPFWQG